mmetsp:Transcript_49511/g.80289  ORF Transcript_49511/g.80289 Transcript_49511/m.80289 type:complete len:264 (-) Transcript_49511:81-872(-)
MDCLLAFRIKQESAHVPDQPARKSGHRGRAVLAADARMSHQTVCRCCRSAQHSHSLGPTVVPQKASEARGASQSCKIFGRLSFSILHSQFCTCKKQACRCFEQDVHVGEWSLERREFRKWGFHHHPGRRVQWRKRRHCWPHRHWSVQTFNLEPIHCAVLVSSLRAKESQCLAKAHQRRFSISVNVVWPSAVLQENVNDRRQLLAEGHASCKAEGRLKEPAIERIPGRIGLEGQDRLHGKRTILQHGSHQGRRSLPAAEWRRSQ